MENRQIEDNVSKVNYALDDLVLIQAGLEGIGELLLNTEQQNAGYAVMSTAKHVRDLLNQLDSGIFQLFEGLNVEGYKGPNYIESSAE